MGIGKSPKQRKLIIIIILGIIGIPISIFIAKNEIGTFDSTRSQINTFYETGLDSCKITKTFNRKYPGKGDYSLFKVDCIDSVLPILLENMTAKDKELFRLGSVITKDENDYNFTLQTDGIKYKMIVRYIENEKDSWGIPFIMFWIMLLGFMICLAFTPNHKFRV
jgi:hypothetical protein